MQAAAAGRSQRHLKHSTTLYTLMTLDKAWFRGLYVCFSPLTKSLRLTAAVNLNNLDALRHNQSHTPSVFVHFESLFPISICVRF